MGAQEWQGAVRNRPIAPAATSDLLLATSGWVDLATPTGTAQMPRIGDDQQV
jgi:hypothetical protein